MRYQTISTSIAGGICGHLWLPAVKGCLPHSFDLRRRFDRFSDGRGATFRDALLSELREHGGDFQDAAFTADTELTIVRAYTETTGNGRSVTRRHVKTVPVADLPGCADLVDVESYSWDFGGED